MLFTSDLMDITIKENICFEVQTGRNKLSTISIGVLFNFHATWKKLLEMKWTEKSRKK